MLNASVVHSQIPLFAITELIQPLNQSLPNPPTSKVDRSLHFQLLPELNGGGRLAVQAQGDLQGPGVHADRVPQSVVDPVTCGETERERPLFNHSSGGVLAPHFGFDAIKTSRCLQQNKNIPTPPPPPSQQSVCRYLPFRRKLAMRKKKKKGANSTELLLLLVYPSLKCKYTRRINAEQLLSAFMGEESSAH